MKRKKLVRVLIPIVLIILIIIGGLYVYKEYLYSKNIDMAKEKLTENYKLIETVNFELETLKEGSFLREGITAQDIKQVEEIINAIKSSYSEYNLKKGDLEAEINDISIEKESFKKRLSVINNQFKIQESVNALFTQDTLAIDGENINTDIVIEDSLNDMRLEEIKDSLLMESEEDSIWQTAINTLIIEAETQLSQIEVATSKVENLVGIVNNQSTISLDDYNLIKTEVNLIKNKKIKKQLSDKLNIIYNKVLDISKLSEKEISRRSLALFMQLYEENNSDSTYNISIFTFDRNKGGIQYMHVFDDIVDAKLRASYSINDNGDVNFYNEFGSSMEISESKTGNIFTDVNESLLNSIRQDVTDLDRSIWTEIEKKQQLEH